MCSSEANKDMRIKDETDISHCAGYLFIFSMSETQKFHKWMINKQDRTSLHSLKKQEILTQDIIIALT